MLPLPPEDLAGATVGSSGTPPRTVAAARVTPIGPVLGEAPGPIGRTYALTNEAHRHLAAQALADSWTQQQRRALEVIGWVFG